MLRKTLMGITVLALLTPIEDLGLVAKTITGCIDPRGYVLDMASPELARVRQRLADVDERVQLKADGTIDMDSVQVQMYVRGTADVVFEQGVIVTDTLQQIHSEVQILLNLFNSQLGWLTPK